MIHHICILSDIHMSLEEKSTEKNILERVEKLSDAICSSLNKQTKSLIIVVNGDVANKGKAEEYAAAHEFFSKLKSSLSEKAHNLQVAYIFSPGNHDCDFDVYDSDDYRKELINKMKDLSSQDYADYLKKLENFHLFCIEAEQLEPTRSNAFYSRYNISNSGHELCIICFNSVLFFDYSFNSDRMIIEDNIFDQIQIPKDSITISFSHYPMEWFKREDNRFHKVLMEESDIVFMSHEHTSDRQIIKNKNGHQVYDFRLPVFYDKDNLSKSGFYMLKIDDVTSAFSIKEYQYDKELYIKSFEDVAHNLRRTLKSPTSFLTINSDHYNYFMRADFRLINYQLKCIDELFVPPTIGIPYVDELDQDYYEYSTIDNYNLYENDKHTVFVFGDSYGKTTLLKHFFRESYEVGYIPIYIKIDSTNNTFDRITSSISDFILEMYGNIDLVEQNKNKILLLIDQISFLKNNTRNILDQLDEVGYFKLVSTFDEKEYTFDLIDWNYHVIEYFRVFKFGHNQKYSMVEKWIELSKFKDLGLVETNQKIKEIKESIDKSDKRLNFINTPEMILIFLDAYEDNRSDTLLINGSKGVFYNFLFSKYILSLAKDSGVEMPFVQRFLEEYAYKLFLNNDQTFAEFSDKFIDDNFINAEYYYDNVTKIKKSMAKLNLAIDYRQGDIDFTYKQFQSYLIAQYYITKFDEKFDEIMELTNKLYDDDIANILLFVVNGNRSKSIINKVIDVADMLFKDLEEIECNSDISIMNTFISGIKDVEVFGDVKKNNKDLYDKLDKIETEIKDKTEKQKKREKTEFEKRNLTTNRLREVINEILSQMVVDKISTEKLITSNLKMCLRRTTALIKFFDEFITYGTVNADEFRDEDLYQFNEARKHSIVSFAASLYEIAENLSPIRYSDYVYRYLKKYYNNNVGNLLSSLVSVKNNRSIDTTDYFNPIINFRDKMLKEKNYICAVLINFALSNEINYVDMSPNKKRVLLEKVHAKQLSKPLRDPMKMYEQSQKNKRTRIDNIKKGRQIK